MESKSDRKAAIREYKEKKTSQGIYEVRSLRTGKVWVGASRNLEATNNSLWFSLRLNSYLDKSLQAEWNASPDPADFAFEILETLEDDVAPLAAKDQLKQKLNEWVSRKSAIKLL